MKIIIQIKNRQIKIILQADKKEIDTIVIEDEYKLSEELLPMIDKLLKKNKLTPAEIEKVEVDSDQDDNFTTTRLAKTVATTWELK